MPLKPLPYREVARRLRAGGFVQHTQRGSHIKLVRREETGVRVVIVPRHQGVAVGILNSILRQAGLSVEEFELL